MTRSVSLKKYPEVDYTINDMGVSEPRNTPLTAEERKDYYDKLEEMKLDEITW